MLETIACLKNKNESIRFSIIGAELSKRSETFKSRLYNYASSLVSCSWLPAGWNIFLLKLFDFFDFLQLCCRPLEEEVSFNFGKSCRCGPEKTFHLDQNCQLIHLGPFFTHSLQIIGGRQMVMVGVKFKVQYHTIITTNLAYFQPTLSNGCGMGHW